MDGTTLLATLKAEMERAGHNPGSLSKAAGLKVGYVGDLFRKAGEPGVLSFYAIANVLGLTVEQLIGAAPVPDHVSDESFVVPKPGHVLNDANEAAIIGVWRSADLLGRTSILTTLGFKVVPSVVDLDPQLRRAD